MTHIIQAGGGGGASLDAITKGRCEQKITDLMPLKAGGQLRGARGAALTGCFKIFTESSGDSFHQYAV